MARFRADLKVSATTAGTSPGLDGNPAKPFTREQVEGLVRDGLGDESGAKLIEQRGIDFAPAKDFIQSLKAAGASEAFLNALRAAKHPGPASSKKPLDQVQVILLLAGEVSNHRVAVLVKQRGIDFEPKDDYLQEVRLGGGDDELITALKSAKVTKPASVDPAAEARQAEVRQHVARGAEFAKQRQYAEAEQEYRAAVRLNPQNADLYVGLANILDQRKNWNDAATAAREAIHLNPNNDRAHANLGFALGGKGDRDGEIAEYREALRLNPNNDMAHNNLGVVLEHRGDWDGAIAEYRDAVRLNPKKDLAHANLGLALGHKGDWDGAISEELEAVHLNPNLSDAHNTLGVALEHKGDLRGALKEYRAAYTLGPMNATYKQNYERLLQQVNQ